MDLEKFEQFRRKFDPSFANKVSTGSNNQGPSIKWPSSSNQQQAKQANNEDDDLYS